MLVLKKILTTYPIYVVFDANGKVPDGFLLGNHNPPGAFHECLDVETPSLLEYRNENIVGFKYCIFFIYLFIYLFISNS